MTKVSPKELHVSVDVETGSTEYGAAIYQIGACFKTPDTGIKSFISLSVSKALCAKEGFVFSEDTADWWADQDPELAASVQSGTMHPKFAVSVFYDWVRQIQTDYPDYAIYMWANAPRFDFAYVLEPAFKKYGLKTPWSFYNERDFRTLRALNPWCEYKKPAQAHNAIHDAEAQLDYILAMMQAIE